MFIRKTEKPQFFILLLLVSFGSVGAVLFTPALPAIKSFFQISTAETQFTITSYLIGYALGQLPYAPLANRFGRKKTIYIGISLATLACLLCAFSSIIVSFKLLIFARFLQALGASAGLKVTFTMISDVYRQVEATKKISYIMISFAVAPGISVAIGGWLTQLFSWESCFYFLAVFGVFVLFLSSYLPETATTLDQHALKVHSILKGYRIKLKNKRLVTSGILMGCGTSLIYIFVSKSPFIGINIIGLSPIEFGNYNFIPPLGMVLGTVLTLQFAARFTLLKILLVGFAILFLSLVTMLALFGMNILNVWSLFLPMAFIYLAQSIIYANISSYGLASAENKSNGSAMLNFINLSITVLAVLFVEFVYPESVILLPLSFFISFFIMLIFWVRLKKIDS